MTGLPPEPVLRASMCQAHWSLLNTLATLYQDAPPDKRDERNPGVGTKLRIVATSPCRGGVCRRMEVS